MFIQRKNARYPGNGQVRIGGVFEGYALLKDISIAGCRIECTMYADIKPLQNYILEIIPEKVSQVGKFKITGEARWIREVGYSCEIGFFIVAFPKGKSFQRFVDYISWHPDTGDQAESSSKDRHTGAAVSG